jgi:hypothetical protein
MNTFTIQIATLIGGILSTALTGFIAYKMAQLKITADASERAAERAALKVHEVALNLEKQEVNTSRELKTIGETTKKTLVHVNDQFLIQLRLYKESTRIVADLRKNPEDIEKADMAQKMYEQHEAKQREARDDKNASDASGAVAKAILEHEISTRKVPI